MPKVDALDHLVLTVRDADKACAFYVDILGMTKEVFAAADGSTRMALKFGATKINLHSVGAEFKPNAAKATPGSADICLLSLDPIAQWVTFLCDHAVSIIDGPIKRTGATGAILSVYVRDPDGNLIEISNRLS